MPSRLNRMNTDNDFQNKNVIGPQCECNIPSVLRVCKKPGSENIGRSFWCCSMPRESQCRFFEWVDKPNNSPSKPAAEKRKRNEATDSIYPVEQKLRRCDAKFGQDLIGGLDQTTKQNQQQMSIPSDLSFAQKWDMKLLMQLDTNLTICSGKLEKTMSKLKKMKHTMKELQLQQQQRQPQQPQPQQQIQMQE